MDSISKTGCVVTAEEHQRNGGLGEAIAQLVVHQHPCPMEFVAVNDTFGESGKPSDLLDKYGLSVEDVKTAIKKAINRK